MDAILSYALSFFGLITALADWAVAHPDAAAFYVLLINTIIQKLPWHGADDALAIAAKALKGAMDRRTSR